MCNDFRPKRLMMNSIAERLWWMEGFGRPAARGAAVSSVLAIWIGGLGFRAADSGGVEGVGLYFSFAALSRDFFSVKQEADAGGVSDFHDNFAGCPDGGVRGCDQGFFGNGFTIRDDRDPRGLLGADQQSEGSHGLRRGGWSGGFCS